MMERLEAFRAGDISGPTLSQSGLDVPSRLYNSHEGTGDSRKFLSGPVPSEVRGMVRDSDLITSLLAAKKTLRKSDRDRKAILECLFANPDGLCDEKISQYTGIQKNTASKRRGDLVRDGLVVYAGFHVLTDSRSEAKAWKLSDRVESKEDSPSSSASHYLAEGAALDREPSVQDIIDGMVRTEESLTQQEIFPGIPPRNSDDDPEHKEQK